MDSRLSSGRMRHPNGAHVVGIVDTLASNAYIVAVRSQGYRLLSQGASQLVRWNRFQSAFAWVCENRQTLVPAPQVVNMSLGRGNPGDLTGRLHAVRQSG
jgi:hypothetical protein